MTTFKVGSNEVGVVERISAPADDVWALVGGFNNLPEFDPSSRWSLLENGGRDRRVGVTGGGEIVERMIAFDEMKRTYSYIITETVGLDYPFDNYFSTIVVRDDRPGESCILDWRGWADVRPGRTLEQVEIELAGIYRGIAETLKQRFVMGSG